MDAQARRQGRQSWETSRLEHMVKHGLLTESDAREVESIVSLLCERIVSGEMSEHFADVIVRKLATEKCAAWRARNRGESR